MRECKIEMSNKIQLLAMDTPYSMYGGCSRQRLQNSLFHNSLLLWHCIESCIKINETCKFNTMLKTQRMVWSALRACLIYACFILLVIIAACFISSNTATDLLSHCFPSDKRENSYYNTNTKRTNLLTNVTQQAEF